MALARDCELPPQPRHPLYYKTTILQQCHITWSPVDLVFMVTYRLGSKSLIVTFSRPDSRYKNALLLSTFVIQPTIGN